MSPSPATPSLENSWVDSLPNMFDPWQADEVTDPALLIINDDLAAELGFDSDWLRSDEGVRFLVGNHTLPGMRPVAQAYAGHQFGGFSPLLGDGRALLLGELRDSNGVRRDLHLKGSGRTRYSRGGDGKAAVGPMLREYIIGEAMHALGIPTSRALAVVATNQKIRREEMLPGAVLCRVASSHIRVGSFQYAASLSTEHVKRLLDYAIARHFPDLDEGNNSALAFLDAVMERQIDLIAKWMHVGFIHGVMNTDNMAISGETIDYGPCAFMDSYDPGTVFSSIDHQGRYAYGKQPLIGQWNLARLAESLLPLIDDDSETAVRLATELLQTFPVRFETEWARGMRSKLGVPEGADVSPAFFHRLLGIFEAGKVDYTNGMRALSDVVRAGSTVNSSIFAGVEGFEGWAHDWLNIINIQGRGSDQIATELDRHNPAYVPRNHLVELALAAGTAGDLQPTHDLLAVLRDPFTSRPENVDYARPMPSDWEGYQTFCGT